MDIEASDLRELDADTTSWILDPVAEAIGGNHRNGRQLQELRIVQIRLRVVVEVPVVVTIPSRQEVQVEVRGVTCHVEALVNNRRFGGKENCHTLTRLDDLDSIGVDRRCSVTLRPCTEYRIGSRSAGLRCCRCESDGRYGPRSHNQDFSPSTVGRLLRGCSGSAVLVQVGDDFHSCSFLSVLRRLPKSEVPKACFRNTTILFYTKMYILQI